RLPGARRARVRLRRADRAGGAVRADVAGRGADPAVGRLLHARLVAPHERRRGRHLMNEIPRQLPLALGFSEKFGREDFLPGPSNAAALALIERWPDWPGRAVGLVGPEGSGKSHLAAIWARTAGARSIASHAITPATVPTALATGALVVEDLREGAGEDAALFHLFNLAREQGDFVLITARTPPSAWTIRLRDLASRLRAVPTVTLEPPD